MGTATAENVSQTQEPTPEAGADPKALLLFYDPPGTLRLTIADGRDRSYHAVKLYQAAPLSRPGRYLVVQNGKGEEIVLVDALSDLLPESRSVAEEELRRRYLTARVISITNVRTEFGVTYWHVDTDRGERDFVIQSLSESCQWLTDDHLLLTDVDGNRFEIASRSALDPVSRDRLAAVL
jgi:hypothetical protein